ncbi:TetR/AcrR family transcriptional regulator [Saccharothrix variisporea]|uniref:TetR family transcriptional regulator n=1 Tax=Saccharothrix variisporea TaxID=543527 RepID=A0A495XCM1_9PSEU|nr:TetR/AcrR family transcriptional regulator [Saccharothrix variisporea]RKT72251.1 TetR family transcriptional regulator [Saccharothrix variisporea]
MGNTRREKYREDTKEEAKRIALEQLAEQGVEGISVNAIAKRMGITGPALYRYFKNRDDLLTDLIRDAWRDLAEQMEATDSATQGRPRRERVHALANAFRTYALREPHRYLLLFGTPLPGYHAPEDTAALAHRTMSALLGVLAEGPQGHTHIDWSWKAADAAPDAGATGEVGAGGEVSGGSEVGGGSGAVPSGAGSALDGQLAAWASGMGEEALPPAVLLTGLRAFTRLHGVVSLEVSGQFGPMGFDPALLYHAEVESLLSD